MEKMGVGLDKEPIRPKKSPRSTWGKTIKPPIVADDSSLETSTFVLNQLRRVLGNRKPKRRKTYKSSATRGDSESMFAQMIG